MSNLNAATIRAIKPTSSNKVQLECTQKIQRPNTSALGLFNADDDRFGQGRDQYAWMTASPAIVKQFFPELSKAVDQVNSTGQSVTLDTPIKAVFENSGKKQALNIRVVETNTAQSDWDIQNPDRALKQDGRGNYMSVNGYGIFQRKDLVIGEPNHIFVEHDGTTTDPESLKYEYQGLTLKGSDGELADEDSAKPIADSAEEANVMQEAGKTV